jgi:hypothetical protein
MQGLGRYFILFLVLTGTVEHANAQLDDTQLRTETKFQYIPAKNWSMYGSYRLDLNQNISAFRRSNFEVGGSYDLLKWLRIGTAYRFVTSYTRDFHRFEWSLSARKSFLNKKIQVAYTTTVQSNIDYINRDYLAFNDPIWVYRNKLRLRYSPDKHWNIQAYTELFAWTRRKETDFYRLRSGIGASYAFNKKHELSAGYFYQNEFNIRNADNIQAIVLEYTYTPWIPAKRRKNKGHLVQMTLIAEIVKSSITFSQL